MCNIAGYVGNGKKEAAPILLEMLRAQEGFAGGYYSGIATVHEGRIYYAKLTGDVDFASVEPIASAITPVPGGVGPMTITMLLKNTLTAARNKTGK